MNNLNLIETLVSVTPQTVSNALEVETNDLWAVVQYPNWVNSKYRVELVSKRTLIEASYEHSEMRAALDWLAGMVKCLNTSEWDAPLEVWEYN